MSSLYAVLCELKKNIGKFTHRLWKTLLALSIRSDFNDLEIGNTELIRLDNMLVGSLIKEIFNSFFR